MLSFTSYGEWTELWEREDGDNIFIAFDRLIVKDEYVYFWVMTSNNTTSQQLYLQSDCDLIRMKTIQATSYDQPLGEGEGTTLKEKPWEYLAPKSGGEFMVDLLCGLAKETPEEKEKNIEKIVNLIKESSTKTPPNAYASEDSWECNNGHIRHNNGCKPEVIDYGLTDQQNKDLLELEIAELKSEQEKILYNRMLAQAIQDEQDTTRSIIIEDQLNRLKSSYVIQIASKVKTLWRYQAAEDDWTAEVYVVQDREGNVKAVDVRNVNVGDSSLGKSFMDSIERAIYKASPLPAAPDEAVFDKELYFIFKVN